MCLARSLNINVANKMCNHLFALTVQITTAIKWMCCGTKVFIPRITTRVIIDVFIFEYRISRLCFCRAYKAGL